jgi:hypothetical protein
MLSRQIFGAAVVVIGGATQSLFPLRGFAMRALVLTLILLSAWTSFGSVEAMAATNLSRTEIRAMPIHERPNRTGHFYGNTVRRRAARGR